MSKPRTHYIRPMTMGQSICRVGKAVVYAIGGPSIKYKARVHASTVEMVGTIEETTCKLCIKAYYGDNPPCPACKVWSETWPDGHCPECEWSGGAR